MAKKKRIKSDDYFRVDMHICYQWCLHNGVKVYPKPRRVNKGTEKRPIWYATGEIDIIVENNGVITKSPEPYTKKDVYKKIWELYCYIYDKNM
jgi:hypothetical protein